MKAPMVPTPSDRLQWKRAALIFRLTLKWFRWQAWQRAQQLFWCSWGGCWWSPHFHIGIHVYDRCLKCRARRPTESGRRIWPDTDWEGRPVGSMTAAAIQAHREGRDASIREYAARRGLPMEVKEGEHVG
jgi:hypothetical protein